MAKAENASESSQIAGQFELVTVDIQYYQQCQVIMVVFT